MHKRCCFNYEAHATLLNTKRLRVSWRRVTGDCFLVAQVKAVMRAGKIQAQSVLARLACLSALRKHDTKQCLTNSQTPLQKAVPDPWAPTWPMVDTALARSAAAARETSAVLDAQPEPPHSNEPTGWPLPTCAQQTPLCATQSIRYTTP
jgi:hypothetical protein